MDISTKYYWQIEKILEDVSKQESISSEYVKRSLGSIKAKSGENLTEEEVQVVVYGLLLKINRETREKIK